MPRSKNTAFRRDELLSVITTHFRQNVTLFYRSGYENSESFFENPENHSIFRPYLQEANRKKSELVAVFYKDDRYYIEWEKPNEYIRVSNTSNESLRDVKRWLKRHSRKEDQDPITCKTACELCYRDVTQVSSAETFNMLNHVCGRCNVLICRVCETKLHLQGKHECSHCKAYNPPSFENRCGFLPTLERVYERMAKWLFQAAHNNEITKSELSDVLSNFPELRVSIMDQYWELFSLTKTVG